MELQEKLKYLKELSEEDFRQKILMPLFIAMEFKGVIEYHGGTLEKGKDIIFWDIDRLRNNIYFAVVAKKGDITGSVENEGGAKTILHQVEQCFDEPYTNIYNLEKIDIHQVIIAVSGSIKKTAVESILGYCKKHNLDKLVQFMDGEKLVPLLDQYLDYFSGLEKTKDKEAQLQKLATALLKIDQENPGLVPKEVYTICLNTVEVSGDSRRDANIILGTQNIGIASGTSLTLEPIIMTELTNSLIVDVGKYIKCDMCSRFFPLDSKEIRKYDNKNICRNCISSIHGEAGGV